MTVGETQSTQLDPVLTADLLAHISAQLHSARRMLAIVLDQADAIRARAVPRVVRLAGALQAEMHRREAIEIERRMLLNRAGLTLSQPADEITVAMLTDAMDPEAARFARAQSAELRGLLSEIQHEHTTNRALMQQELSFLDHLLQLAGSGSAYGSSGQRHSTARRSALMRSPVFELEA